MVCGIRVGDWCVLGGSAQAQRPSTAVHAVPGSARAAACAGGGRRRRGAPRRRRTGSGARATAANAISSGRKAVAADRAAAAGPGRARRAAARRRRARPTPTCAAEQQPGGGRVGVREQRRRPGRRRPPVDPGQRGADRCRRRTARPQPTERSGPATGPPACAVTDVLAGGEDRVGGQLQRDQQGGDPPEAALAAGQRVRDGEDGDRRSRPPWSAAAGPGTAARATRRRASRRAP